MTKENYRTKQDDIYNKFSPEFQKKINENALARKVFDCMVYEMDVYQLLEQLVSMNVEQQKSFENFVNTHICRPILPK